METLSLASIVFLSVFVCVEADYRLEILLSSYNNPTHQCAECGPGGSLGCCEGDRSSSCSENARCNNMFIFCLRPLQTSNLDFTFCPLGENSTRRISRGDNIEFGLGEQILSGLPNPLVFTGDRWPGGVQLYAGVRNADGLSLDLAKLVDRFIIKQNITVGENFSAFTNHSGEFNFGHFVVSLRVTCTENFFGSDCATFCVERDDELGHFTCDREGNIVCREGYTGENCTIDLDHCGHMTPCENGATCNNTGPDQYECLCAAGFEGVNCTIDLDRCGHTTPCENGTTCNNTGPDQYECLCAAGFEGVNCERETNECDPNPCMNGGTCTDLLAGYNCSCPAGFRGTNCDQEEGMYTSGTLSTGTQPLLAPVIGGVTGGTLLLLVISVVILTVATYICVRQRNAVLKGHLPPKGDIDTKPNPVYGVSGPQESQDYYALDHTHKTSGDIDDTYDNVN